MILKISQGLRDFYYQCENVSSQRCKADGLDNALHITYPDCTEINPDGVHLLVYPRNESSASEICLFTNCATYLMNDSGKTVERLY